MSTTIIAMYDNADKAQQVANVIGKGSAMLTVDAPDESADETFELMNRLGAKDLDELMAEAEASQETEQTEETEETVPVVEEQVSVGKRKVLRGGIRVTSTVTERPVEETVELREEKVDVEEKRADRKLSPEEAEKAFEKKTLEVAETAEEAVISKEARVVGEVSLSKTASEREETVKTKARRTDVKVEEIDAEDVKRRKQ